ncbi:response regulator [Candidatus Parcubacteria bacterium]|nr:MAG: response regulator [Candidatus Parcubacteria bacterium]
MKQSNKRTVLVVEDQFSMAEALSLKLKKSYKVLVANDGEEGLNIGLKKNPDLVMLDIMMPKMDGLTVLEKIREDDSWGASVPVIMLTNISDPVHVAEAAKFGVFDFLVKTDWKLDDVVDLVNRRVENIPDEEEEE